MPRQQRDKSNTGYYHIMIRGNDRKNIFVDEQEKMYFIEILKTKKKITDMVSLQEREGMPNITMDSFGQMPMVSLGQQNIFPV